jgi:hypothetical protein
MPAADSDAQQKTRDDSSQGLDWKPIARSRSSSCNYNALDMLVGAPLFFMCFSPMWAAMRICLTLLLSAAIFQRLTRRTYMICVIKRSKWSPSIFQVPASLFYVYRRRGANFAMYTFVLVKNVKRFAPFFAHSLFLSSGNLDSFFLVI